MIENMSIFNILIENLVNLLDTIIKSVINLLWKSI
jgi:hypothetical protein